MASLAVKDQLRHPQLIRAISLFYFTPFIATTWMKNLVSCSEHLVPIVLSLPINKLSNKQQMIFQSKIKVYMFFNDVLLKVSNRFIVFIILCFLEYLLWANLLLFLSIHLFICQFICLSIHPSKYCYMACYPLVQDTTRITLCNTYLTLSAVF